MVRELTGLLSFLHFAGPCAEHKLRLGLITKEDFDFLGVLLEHEDVINHSHIELFKRCFPLAVRDLYNYAEANNIKPEKIWSREVVDEVWQNHHGHRGTHCAVTKATVCSVDSVSKKVVVIRGGKTFTVMNTYTLQIVEGDSVFIHWGVIVKKSEEI